MIRSPGFFILRKKINIKIKATNASERTEKLLQLKKAIENHEEDILQAIKSDFRKPKFEIAAYEIIALYNDIAYHIANLPKWMEPVKAPSNSPEAEFKIVYEPKGVCLIISPWNFPFQLLGVLLLLHYFLHLKYG